MTQPLPHRERWQPLRAGVVDLFYYDVEEFHFHGGSLLYRGNNGTGKSKLLALTLPFLLDGDLSPSRVEPDGDRNKRMEWNLLLGGKYPHPERLGYTWLEFGRRDADGTDRFLTLGCGLKAVAGRGIAKHWFFVTDQRVGPELSLLNPTRTALTRERLREAIGDRGMVYDRAGDYRRAVDEALFGLGARYDALVSLLIQLRQPQLSKRPDEKLLSRALTEALPPLDENLIAQVAEAFRSLDDEREALHGLRETKRAADEFLTGYLRYAKIAAKRQAARLREAHSRYERFGRDLGDTERAHAEAEEALRIALGSLEELETERVRLEATDRALRASPEMRDAANLDQAALRARELTRFAATQRTAHETAAKGASRYRDRLARAQTALAGAEVDLKAAGDAADAAARAARIDSEHRDRVIVALSADAPPYPSTREAVDRLVEWRTASVRGLSRLLDVAATAEAALGAARTRVDEATTELSAAATRILDAERAAADRGADLVADIRGHLAECAELRLADPERTLAELDVWVETLDGDNPATEAATVAFRSRTEELTRAQLGYTAQRTTLETLRGALSTEIDQLAAGGHQPPPAPRTRAADTRTDRSGAPLWRVVDFAPGVSDQDRALLEAALEAAGILDAWILPDGTLLAPTTDDVLLRADTATTTNLTAVLRPAIDPADPLASALEEATVLRVLAGIGLGPGTGGTWVAADGRFALGVLTGHWAKPTAEHIGEGAREQARRSRLAKLRDELAETETILGQVAERLAEVEGRRSRLAAEYRDWPRDAALREAHILVRGAYDQQRTSQAAHAKAEQESRQATVRVEAAGSAVAEFAADVDLPTGRTELAGVGSAVGEYRIALASLWPAAAALATATDTEGDARTELAGAEKALTDAAEEHARAAGDAAMATAYHAELAATVGTAVAELQRRLDATAEAGLRRATAERSARAAERDALTARGEANGRRVTLVADLDVATGIRDASVESLRTFAGTGLLALACPGLDQPAPGTPWAATPAVAVARAIDRDLADTDDTDRRWEIAQQNVNAGFKLLADGLSRHGHTAVLSVREDVLLIDATFQGRTGPVTHLAASLETEVDERQRVLSAHEREVLETHLVNEVAGALQDLISTAERQVADMNTELENRPTSTGMRLRLLWRPARTAPAGLAPLRDRQLRQHTDVWNEQDRTQVGAFLQDQISTERLRDDAGTWQEQLTRALDYRAWHEFAIQRHQDGQWRPATGPASGGERVLAATVPLFAAASSYYSSAGNPHAPRLIALDEAFAGVDDDSRAKCLGLLAKFDLDVVMTSEREWGCYPEVPGLAIAQLARRDGIDAVLVTPWKWDGTDRVPVARPIPFIPAQPGPPEPEGLFP